MLGVRSILLALAAALACLTAGDVEQAAAQDAGRATISGRVTDTSGNPLEDICVRSEAPVPPYGLGWDTTDADGRYSMDVDPGRRRVGFSPCYIPDVPPRNLVPQAWNGRTASLWGGDVFEVAAGEHRTGIDAVLREGGRLTGRVLTDTGEPAGGICVDAAHLESKVEGNGIVAPGLGGWATSAPDGSYEIVGLPTGAHTIRYWACEGGPFLNQWYLGKRASTADEVHVVEGSATPLQDVTMERAGLITGRVTDPTGSPIAGACVHVRSLEPTGPDDFWDMAPGGRYETDADGRYRTWSIRPGSYQVTFGSCNGAEPWAPQSWNGRIGPAFDPVTVGSGETVSGIDAELRPGARIGGRVTTFAGEPVAGICVRAISSSGDVVPVTSRDNGAYTTPVLPEGDYKVGFTSCESTAFGAPLLPQFFDGKATAADADVVELTGGQDRTDVGARLIEGARPACVVPDLAGRRLAAAKESISDAHCDVGDVSRKKSNKPKGRVLKHRPVEGSQRPRRSEVKLVLSSGRG